MWRVRRMLRLCDVKSSAQKKLVRFPLLRKSLPTKATKVLSYLVYQNDNVSLLREYRLGRLLGAFVC